MCADLLRVPLAGSVHILMLLVHGGMVCSPACRAGDAMLEVFVPRCAVHTTTIPCLQCLQVWKLLQFSVKSSSSSKSHYPRV